MFFVLHSAIDIPVIKCGNGKAMTVKWFSHETLCVPAICHYHVWLTEGVPNEFKRMCLSTFPVFACFAAYFFVASLVCLKIWHLKIPWSIIIFSAEIQHVCVCCQLSQNFRHTQFDNGDSIPLISTFWIIKSVFFFFDGIIQIIHHPQEIPSGNLT